MNHHLSILFPSIPFLWHYDDFGLPFPVLKSKQVDKQEFIDLIQNFNNHTVKNMINKIDNSTTEFHVIVQHRQNSIFYNETTDFNEMYVSFHTWLHKNHKKTDSIDYQHKYKQFYRFYSGIYSLVGNIFQSKQYPEIEVLNKSKNETVKIPVGVPVDNRIEIRRASIHDSKGIIRFSDSYSCKFELDPNTKNFAFISIMRFPFNKKTPIRGGTTENIDSVITLHIFRNDDNIQDESFQTLMNTFFN